MFPKKVFKHFKKLVDFVQHKLKHLLETLMKILHKFYIKYVGQIVLHKYNKLIILKDKIRVIQFSLLTKN